MKEVKVLGSEGCSKCTVLKEDIAKLISDKAIDAKVEKITDIVEVMSYGVMSAPALVVDGEVKVVGRLPNMQEVEELISK